MAFFVRYISDDPAKLSGKVQEAQFHMGVNEPINYDWEILEVQADGHELDAIKCQMNNIPTSRKRSQRWFGDMAAFIAHNIKFTT